MVDLQGALGMIGSQAGIWIDYSVSARFRQPMRGEKSARAGEQGNRHAHSAPQASYPTTVLAQSDAGRIAPERKVSKREVWGRRRSAPVLGQSPVWQAYATRQLPPCRCKRSLDAAIRADGRHARRVMQSLTLILRRITRMLETAGASSRRRPSADQYASSWDSSR